MIIKQIIFIDENNRYGTIADKAIEISDKYGISFKEALLIIELDSKLFNKDRKYQVYMEGKK